MMNLARNNKKGGTRTYSKRHSQYSDSFMWGEEMSDAILKKDSRARNQHHFGVRQHA